MATKVQTKPYFLGSKMDLNSGFCNGMWNPCHPSQDDRNPGYNSIYMSKTMDGHHGYQKEQTRQTILKQESIFRHQLQELHRVYRRQKDLMNELMMKEWYKSEVPVGAAANSSSLSSQFASRIGKEMHTQRRVIDLELPTGMDEQNEGNQQVKNRAYSLADLNQPVHMQEASFAASVINRNNDFRHHNLSRKRTIFGVELFESSHKPFFDSSLSSSRDQNTTSANNKVHNRWIEPCEKEGGFYGRKTHENLENQLPQWLMKAKGKETTVYQMNLDSLQQNSQQFFKKVEKLQTDNLHGITKILGVPIINSQDSPSLTQDNKAENDKKKNISESRQVIDLNVSFNEVEEEEESETVASMEINLQTPAALVVEPDVVISMDIDGQELVQSAAEAIVSLSSYESPPADTLLRWLAEVIASGDGLGSSVNADKDEDCVPEGMDYFEYMTVNLEETKEEYCCYEAVIVAEKEEECDLFRKRRKGQGKRGRQRKDFQRDVLPGIVSLSRREVTEDLQAFEQAFNCIGVSWQSKRKAGGKNGRGRPRLAVPTSPLPSPPPPPPPQPAAVAAVEKSVCRELALEEKSLSGWGKRTRRLPRQRCQSGGNHQSVALKC